MERFVEEDAFLVSKTDPKGIITYANQSFIKIVGARDETQLLGKPHNIIRHPDMPKVIFKYLWDMISVKKEVSVFVKNKTLDGNFYWVFANVTASLEGQRIIGYYSVRRRPNFKGVEFIAKVYASLLESEKRGGMDASSQTLQEFLEQEKTDIDKLMNILQRSA